jgi:hypothetical protein
LAQWKSPAVKDGTLKWHWELTHRWTWMAKRVLPWSLVKEVPGELHGGSLEGWTKWHWGRFSPSTSVSPANFHSTNCSTITLIYHLGLAQQARSGRSTSGLSPTPLITIIINHWKDN